MANRRRDCSPEEAARIEYLSHLTPAQAEMQQVFWADADEEVRYLRRGCDLLGFHAICPDRSCGRAGACCGRETLRTRMLPPCFICYREEYRFLTQSPWSIPAILDMLRAEEEPMPPATPGYLAWSERVMEGMLESLLRRPERTRRGMMAIIYGLEGLPMLRRSLDAPKGRSYEVNPDAFAAAMAMGDWRGPMLPRGDPPHLLSA